MVSVSAEAPPPGQTTSLPLAGAFGLPHLSHGGVSSLIPEIAHKHVYMGMIEGVASLNSRRVARAIRSPDEHRAQRLATDNVRF